MFTLDQLQSIMSQINDNAHDLFSAEVSVVQVQYRPEEEIVWVAYDVYGVRNELSVPVEPRPTVDSEYLYKVQAQMVSAMKKVSNI